MMDSFLDHLPSDSTKLTLREIGAHFAPLPALVGSVAVVRAAPVSEVTDTNYGQAHNRLLGMLGFVMKSTEGLGERLCATGVCPDGMAVEHQIRQFAVQGLRGTELMLIGAQSERDQRPLPPVVAQSAEVLSVFGLQLATLPPTVDPDPALASVPLSAQGQRFRDLLLKQSADACITSGRLCELYQEGYGAGIEASDFRKRIVPPLKKLGLETHGRRGYVFPAGCLARRQHEAGRRG